MECFASILPIRIPRILHTRLNLKNTLNPVPAGYRLSNRDNQISQLNQLHQYLRHIIHKSHHSPLRNYPAFHPPCSDPNQHNNRAINNNISNRIHQRRNLSHILLHRSQPIITLLKPGDLTLLLIKGPQHTHPRQILPRNSQNPVKPSLHLLIKRHRNHHNTENHHRKHRNCHHKNQSRLHINRKSHNHSPEHNKRRTQKQTQHHIHPILHLIRITRHPRNQRRSPDSIHLRKRQPLNMSKQSMLHLSRKPNRCLRSKILSRNRTHQPDHPQHYHNQAHLPDIPPVPITDTRINNSRHNQRHQQLKRSLQQLKKRRQNRLLLIILQINK